MKKLYVETDLGTLIVRKLNPWTLADWQRQAQEASIRATGGKVESAAELLGLFSELYVEYVDLMAISTGRAPEAIELLDLEDATEVLVAVFKINKMSF